MIPSDAAIRAALEWFKQRRFHKKREEAVLALAMIIDQEMQRKPRINPQ